MQLDTATLPIPADTMQPAHVLVVDDDVAVGRMISFVLRRHGLTCDVVESSADALLQIERSSYDLVLTDVHMPGSSGLELARRLKANDAGVQVVIMTGSSTVDTAIEALRLNADDFLKKPFEPAALVHSARRALEHRRLLLENLDHRRNLEARVAEQARRIEGLYLASFRSLAQALEAKDPITHGHSERVCAFALALAERVGDIDVEAVRIGSQLHDIGKIGVDSEVLRKPGPLTAEQLEQIRRHPSIGVDILTPVLDDRVALGIVQHHHERWDGEGYPDGLQGTDIPLGARIVAVADAFDAITHKRPYRATRRPEDAVTELLAEAGRQFDPAVVAHARAALLA